MEMEHDLERMRRRFQELIVKKASGILRDEFNLLEAKYKLSLQEVKKHQTLLGKSKQRNILMQQKMKYD